ncbi:MAG: SGNH/GDSL hydrolase family protein [Deltaproteobacteria bacterium]|nr:SGNH/GDSL hydrolase family protein [Deltaproteobacteria bacterium]
MRESIRRLWRLGVPLFVVAFIVLTHGEDRLTTLLVPIDVRDATGSVYAEARWNRLELGPRDGHWIDAAPESHPDELSDGFIARYDVIVRRMGTLAIDAIAPDNRRFVLARLDRSHFWPYVAQILDGRPLELAIKATADGAVSVFVDGESRSIENTPFPPPFSIKMQFEEGTHLAILNRTIAPTDPNNSLLTLGDNPPVDQWRADGQGMRKWIALAMFVALALVWWTGGEHAPWRSDFRGPQDLVAASLLLVTPVGLEVFNAVSPSWLLLALVGIAFWHGAFALWRQGRIKLGIAVALLPIFVNLFWVSASGVPAIGVFLSAAVLTLMGAQEAFIARREKAWAAPMAGLALVLVLLPMEWAARAAYPDGRILRGASASLFDELSEGRPNVDDAARLAPSYPGSPLLPPEERDRPAVVLLGGSVVYGSDVDPKMNVADLLRDRLGEAASVHNAAGVGLVSTQLADRFVRYIAPLRPEVVVVYARHNDIFQSGPFTLRQMREGPPTTVAKARGLLRQSVLYRLAAETVARYKERRHLGRPPDDAIVGEFRASVGEIVDAATAYGGQVILVPEAVVLPEDLTPVVRRLGEVLREFGSRDHVRVIDFDLPQKDKSGAELYTDDVHLTVQGYQHLTDALEAPIRRALDASGGQG